MAEVRECRRRKEHYMMLFLRGDAFLPPSMVLISSLLRWSSVSLEENNFSTRTTDNQLEIKAKWLFFFWGCCCGLQRRSLKATQRPIGWTANQDAFETHTHAHTHIPRWLNLAAGKKYIKKLLVWQTKSNYANIISVPGDMTRWGELFTSKGLSRQTDWLRRGGLVSSCSQLDFLHSPAKNPIAPFLFFKL